MQRDENYYFFSSIFQNIVNRILEIETKSLVPFRINIILSNFLDLNPLGFKINTSPPIESSQRERIDVR